VRAVRARLTMAAGNKAMHFMICILIVQQGRCMFSQEPDGLPTPALRPPRDSTRWRISATVTADVIYLEARLTFKIRPENEFLTKRPSSSQRDFTR